MGRIGTFLMGFVLGGATIYGALHYHVVRAEDGLHLVPKLQSTFAETYVDIRGFGLDEWVAHRDLALAIYQARKPELLEGVPLDLLRHAADQFFGLLQSP